MEVVEVGAKHPKVPLDQKASFLSQNTKNTLKLNISIYIFLATKNRKSYFVFWVFWSVCGINIGNKLKMLRIEY